VIKKTVIPLSHPIPARMALSSEAISRFTAFCWPGRLRVIRPMEPLFSKRTVFPIMAMSRFLAVVAEKYIINKVSSQQEKLGLSPFPLIKKGILLL
jgi:hypothetical protein